MKQSIGVNKVHRILPWFSCHSVLDTESEVGKWTNAFVGKILKQVQNDTKGMANKN